MGQVRPAKRITVKRVSGQRYPEVVGYELGEIEAVAEDAGGEDEYDDLPF